MKTAELEREWKRRLRIRQARLDAGDRAREAMMTVIKENNPCNLTSTDLAQKLDLSRRQVERHLQTLRLAGVIKSETKYLKRPGMSHLLTLRTITVVDLLHGHPVPEGQVRREADAPSWSRPASNDPEDPQDLQ